MLGGASNNGGDLPHDIEQKVRKLCEHFEKDIIHEVTRSRYQERLFPAIYPCNIVCVVDKKRINIAFTNENAGGMPLQRWIDHRELGEHTAKEIQQVAEERFAFTGARVICIPTAALEWEAERQQATMKRLAMQYVEAMVKRATRPSAISGYEGMQPWLDSFSQEHPHFDSNVFLAMRFVESAQHARIASSIRAALSPYGLTVLRADDKMYPTDNDIWTNICVYMMGCRYGVCVFEEINIRKFNPNVPLEYGFMRAMNRQVLLLKDQAIEALPTDIVGKLYRPFNTYQIEETLEKELRKWAESDLGRRPHAL